MSRPARPRRRGAHARRPQRPLRQRLQPRVRRWQRLVSAALFATLLGALLALVYGPWTRVTQVGWQGERFTPPEALAAVAGPLEGASLVSLDGRIVAHDLRRLPAVAAVHVEATLPGRLTLRIDEKRPTFVWQTSAALLIGTADGTLIGQFGLDQPLPGDLTHLPRIVDLRRASNIMAVGDHLPPAFVATGVHLLGVDPKALGSSAPRLSVQIDDIYGFTLISTQPAWSAAFGFYGLDPTETSASVAARIDRQVTAVRTLFATQSESSVGWVDARNPGKVYFRGKG